MKKRISLFDREAIKKRLSTCLGKSKDAVFAYVFGVSISGGA
jgi:hypothetical protein